MVAEACVGVFAVALLAFAAQADLPWFERHVYVAYCARSTTTVWLPLVARMFAIALAAACILVVRPRLLGWLSRASRAQLVAVAFAIVAALGVADVLMTRISHATKRTFTRTDIPHVVRDADLGYRFVPSQTYRGFAIDAEGNRAASQDARTDVTGPTVILAGESVAFGESLVWNESLAAQLEHAVGRQVVNLGVPAYSLDQTYRRLLEVMPRLQRVEAVVTTMVPFSIRREGSQPSGLSRLWNDEPYHDDARIDAARQRIADIELLARARGARPLFVLVNYGDDCVDPDPWFVRVLFEHPARPYIRVYLPPDERIGATDFHPNARGAKHLSGAIAAALHD